MSIDAITGSTPSAASDGATTPGMKGTKDEFLRLFMAQLQHQDPFAPTSGADMVAQLAQLSSVEQAKQTNDQLAQLAATQASAASASLSSLVGRTCDAAAAGFELVRGGAPPPLSVTSESPMKGASVVIEDASGKEIRRIAIPDGTRDAAVAWDGKDASGNPVGPGNYKISVDAGQSASAIDTRWRGRVDAVELTADGPRLRMAGVLLAPGDIRVIGGAVRSPDPSGANP